MWGRSSMSIATALAYEVEFTTLNGDTAAVVTVEAAQVRPANKREITHARELQPA